MNSRIKTWHKGLALTLPLIALLAGCNRGDKAEGFAAKPNCPSGAAR